MPIPTHGSDCRMRMYGADCRYCGSRIYILQCSCGSVVLFNNNYSPFDEHICSGGIGDSGLSGWNAIETLQNVGVPISKQTKAIVFGQKPSEENNNREIRPDIISVSPRKGQTVERILNLMDFHTDTKATEDANSLTDIGRQIEGLPKSIKFKQVTLLSNEE